MVVILTPIVLRVVGIPGKRYPGTKTSFLYNDQLIKGADGIRDTIQVHQGKSRLVSQKGLLSRRFRTMK